MKQLVKTLHRQSPGSGRVAPIFTVTLVPKGKFCRTRTSCTHHNKSEKYRDLIALLHLIQPFI